MRGGLLVDLRVRMPRCILAYPSLPFLRTMAGAPRLRDMNGPFDSEGGGKRTTKKDTAEAATLGAQFPSPPLRTGGCGNTCELDFCVRRTTTE
jgi:hypothetical protein